MGARPRVPEEAATPAPPKGTAPASTPPEGITTTTGASRATSSGEAGATAEGGRVGADADEGRPAGGGGSDGKRGWGEGRCCGCHQGRGGRHESRKGSERGREGSSRGLSRRRNGQGIEAQKERITREDIDETETVLGVPGRGGGSTGRTTHRGTSQGRGRDTLNRSPGARSTGGSHQRARSQRA